MTLKFFMTSGNHLVAILTVSALSSCCRVICPCSLSWLLVLSAIHFLNLSPTVVSGKLGPICQSKESWSHRIVRIPIWWAIERTRSSTSPNGWPHAVNYHHIKTHEKNSINNTHWTPAFHCYACRLFNCPQ